jgi:oligoribonuclease (3'-5' exoribonuclease)
MPISRNWVEQEVDGLDGNEHAIARLALVVAKASYQIDDGLVDEVLNYNPEQEQFLRILAWSTFTAARYVAARIARLSDNTKPVLRHVA